ncbi:MAG: tetratricopeptide repeat protein [Planctomycetes bacterium]|nr:tetratricopeptide repeat protein [Planctomycetota bacterium]
MPANHRTIAIAILGWLLAALARADVAEDQYRVAAGHYEAHRWQLAWTEFQDFSQQFAAHRLADDARFFTGESLVQLRRWDEAIELFHELAAATKSDVIARKALFRAGESNYFARRWSAAERDLSAWLARWNDDPLAAYALVYLGDANLELDRLTDAEQNYRQAIERFPKGALAPDARLGLARVFVREQPSQEQHLAEARTFIADIARHGPSHLIDDAAVMQADMVYQAGDFAAAERAYADVVQRFARSSSVDRARLGQAQSLYQLHKYHTARQTLAEVPGTSTLSVDAQYWLGSILLAEGESEAAAATWLAALEKHTPHRLAPALCHGAAQALLAAGQRDAADKHFARVTRDWPNSAEACAAALARVNLALGRGDFAATKLLAEELRAAVNDPNLTAIADQLDVQILIQRHRPDEALARLQEIGESPSLPVSQWPARQLLAAHIWRPSDPSAAREIAADVAGHSAGALQAQALNLWAGACLDLGRWDEALAQLAACHKLLDADWAINTPDRATIDIQCCVALAYAGRLDEAERVWKSLEAMQVESARLTPAAEALAEAAQQTNQTDKAATWLAWLAAPERAPSARSKGLLGQAWQHYHAGKLDAARPLFIEAAKLGSAAQAAEAEFMLGYIAQQQTQHAAAIEHYLNVPIRDPASPRVPAALLAAARLEEQLEHSERAARLYEQLLNLSAAAAQHDTALYGLAWARRQAGDAKGADSALERLHVKFPDSQYWHDAVYRLAEHALQAGDEVRSSQLLGELLGANPSESVRRHAQYLLVQCAIRAGRWDEATEPLEQLAAQTADVQLARLARFWLAERSYRRGDIKAAASAFDTLAKEPAHDTSADMTALRRAQIAAQEKRWDDARELADRLLAERPDFEPRYELDYVRGRCLAAAAQFDEARTAFQQVVRSDQGARTETAAMAQWMIGETYFHQKNYESALREYLRVEILYAYPNWQAAALLEAGKCYTALGQSAQAVESYVRLLKHYPNTPYQADAARLLQSSQQPGEKR